ncbi:Plasmid maintenance system killer protein [Piscirickettsia salmonis]|uniref:type II toxin-antitoxin system RelE/ParE family toxin n=1 Tax=Piscirickettsia salmonis TaxID=1238 RepID=UPI000F07DDA9|nr:type II toxin-antitoxin system RelE/ParE family toxin [Piscirickettsia salmonis]QGP51441.1 Plasmid maintenance system killer protein [Piscirickettsia salmonis]QGP61533.1 Plasmid maintenance system killer protein [Piscirickettsia salmonis]QGP66389.1 Plasmid maintenance system killer protein [Piscirickettsia salmonis]RNC76988.1 peptidase [Piscirickettsiaceae bacterium NZ-RLO2]
MIKSFKHKGLKVFFETGSTKGIQPKHKNKLRIQLGLLDQVTKVEDLNIPGWGLHQLKGTLKDHFSIVVNGNWRLTFKFEDEDVILLNYQDYH